MKHLVTTLLLSLLSTPLLADHPVEILQLNGHPADQVIPVITPFIDKGGSVATMNDQLIIRTSPENLKQIKKIVRNIDRPPGRLMIYVRQGSADMTNDRSRDIRTGAESETDSGRIIGLPSDRGTVKPEQIIGLSPGGAPRGSGGIQAGTSSDRDLTQRVQAVEGKPAYIETGTQVPVYDGAVGVGAYGYGGVVNTRYKRATTGFYALARTSGNQVTVEVSPQQIQQNGATDQFDLQRARTTISGRLGEWMPLGGSSRVGFSDREQGGHSAATTSNQDRSIYLKVESLN